MTQLAIQCADQPLLILVVEDEPMIALDLQLALEDEGVTAQVAASCDEAHALLERHAFDGAILDVNLGPGATCRKVAGTLRSRGIPFVLHTGDLDRQGEAMRELNAMIIPKPTPAPQVIRHILEQIDA
ncbi:response regulator [Erythrobacteraceae bacterium CFH 75059]|uniref:response regulator n=1 Tax=Qipengyuania thermophila TaxID=2509361 RepID=UPI00101F5A44|nr:response regulator [Qipengyuania thermophila]TCD04885.1 response regulator [Erythrobacteraceae bacterium CFH 75059]